MRVQGQAFPGFEWDVMKVSSSNTQPRFLSSTQQTLASDDSKPYVGGPRLNRGLVLVHRKFLQYDGGCERWKRNRHGSDHVCATGDFRSVGHLLLQ